MRELIKRYRKNINPPYNWKDVLNLIATFTLLLTIPLTLYVSRKSGPSDILTNVLAESPVRGTAGDLWADTVLGKRDFGEIAPREIVPYKVSAPGGTIVDRSVAPGRLYLWDSGNSRILGIELAKCYSQSSPCSADLVIGQPSAGDYGACNLDSSFQTYPGRAPASASTLCGISEKTHTTLEDKTFSSMYVDSEGNLYVADSFNHRVLKYVNPFTSDTVADEVWGQTNFSDNGCNGAGIGDGFGNPPPSPSGSTLCFHTIGGHGAGVTLDTIGNLWIADGGNNRVLRFPKDPVTGTISKTADIVLGQANLSQGGNWSGGNSMEKMNGPAAVRFDNKGRLYVADSGNNRVIVFVPPFTSGMAASYTIGGGFSEGPLGIEIDTQGRGLWTFDPQGFDGKLKLWSYEGTLLKELPRIGNPGGGSVGIDTLGNLLASAYVYGQDVYRFAPQPDGTYLMDKMLFSPPGGYNLTSSRRFEHPGWVGLTIVANQLVVANTRILFWNNPTNLTNGQAPDGYVGVGSFTELPNPEFGQIKSDIDSRVWVGRKNEIRVYQAPLTSGASPIKTIVSPVNALGGGSLNFNDVAGIAVTNHSEYLWVSEPGNHRVFRIKDPLTNPLVDVVLGQNTLTGKECNRGLIPAPNSGTTQDADLTMLCYPGALSIDKKGNLYVSDHFLEAQGNWRLLMFAPSLFPSSPSSIIYAPSATKSFPRSSSNNQYTHMTFESAFDGTNRMVVGYNPYSGKRFIEYYNDPTKVNPANPSDPTYAQPDGQLKDFYGWPVAMTFDSVDNLYAYDANRGQIRIYKNPFNSQPPPTPTPIPLIISNISVTNITKNSATVNWTTSIPGTSRVSYGIRSGRLNFSSPFDQTLTTTHAVTLTGLRRDRTYYYRVHSKNEAGVEFSSSTKYFKTSRWARLRIR